MSRGAVGSILTIALVVLALVLGFVPKAKTKLYYVIYYTASIFMMVGLVGALVSFAVEGLYWVRFGAWPEWSFLTQPVPPTGLIGLDRIIAAFSKGPPSVQLLVVWLASFLVASWFERLSKKAERKEDQ
jgi:hypothetical protein